MSSVDTTIDRPYRVVLLLTQITKFFWTQVWEKFTVLLVHRLLMGCFSSDTRDPFISHPSFNFVHSIWWSVSTYSTLISLLHSLSSLPLPCDHRLLSPPTAVSNRRNRHPRLSLARPHSPTAPLVPNLKILTQTLTSSKIRQNFTEVWEERGFGWGWPLNSGGSNIGAGGLEPPYPQEPHWNRREGGGRKKRKRK